MSDSTIKEYNPENDKLLLSDVLDRVLKKGVVVSGDLTIGIGNIDLIYVGVRLLLASVDTIYESNQKTEEEETKTKNAD
jgi:hypothetical protein